MPAFDHVFVVVMENHSYSEIIGNPAAPYINSLASSGASATNYYAVAHPSLPNYLALTGGATFGVASDCATCWVASGNLGDRVEGVGKTWKTYMESIPSPCYVGDSSPYFQKHDPLIYFNDIRTSASRCQSHVVGYTQLATDLRSTSSTPNYAFISPNICSDMHDCTIATGDQWLQRQVPGILASAAFKTQRSLLVLTWDEDDSSSSNHVPLILIGTGVAPGGRSAVTYNHYSLVHTIELALGLPTLTSNDANQAPITDLFGAAPPPPPPAAFTAYFSWFDNATRGMGGDYIHLLNPGTVATSGRVSVGSRSVAFNVGAGAETYVTFPAGTIGGPVRVTANQPLRASQRVRYYQSFNEVWAMTAAQAAATSYINWFDRASPGMVGDNIHVINPGSTNASVSVTMAGARPIAITIQAGAEWHVSFPAGSIGGPVKIVSSQPVLASQRVQYYQSFNEVLAHSVADAATASYFNWFDRATAGMVGDNIHILNPGSSAATVTLSLPGVNAISFSLATGAETHVTFPIGAIGGPVKIVSSQPVLASQRVQYYQSFNEVGSSRSSSPRSYVLWFDKASTGMLGDNIHILNAGSTGATVTISLPGATPIVVAAGPQVELHVTFPAGKIGGPVTINSTQPVLAAQRVQYYQSFNEVPSG